MNGSHQVNPYVVTAVAVDLNSPKNPDLIRLDVVELENIYSSTYSLAMERAQWQEVADQLATLGVIAQAVKA